MRITLFLMALCVFLPDNLAGADARCQVHTILFVPSDARPPRGYQERIDEIVDYGESFFRTELKRWGHNDIVLPFRRKADGHVEVTVIAGQHSASHYKPVSVRMEVMDHLRRLQQINENFQIWWIMVYVGDPPKKFDGCLGGFGPQIGGWAVCNLDMTPGRINPAEPLGSDFLERIQLKALFHELGHGFRLPHVGPQKQDNAGNTLMGPTHFNFRRVTSLREDRVYLSEAEAAMFASHPAFRGKPDKRHPLPRVSVEDLRYESDSPKRGLTVSGRIRSPQGAIYAIVADESTAQPGDYWTKTYVGRVEQDGSFEVIVSELADANGTLKTWFAFNDGSLTGDGKLVAREGGIAKPYTYSRRHWTFR